MFVPTSITVRQARRFVGLALLLAVAAVYGKSAWTQQVEKSATGNPAGPASAKPNDVSGTAKADQAPAKAAEPDTATAKTKEEGTHPSHRRTIRAHVVALDQPYMWNRLGASQPNAMIYALARDVVPTDYEPKYGKPTPPFSQYEPGKVRLREDKRPRPLVLRAGEGDLLEVKFTNLLSKTEPTADASITRYAGFHPMGLELVGSIDSDSSWVGTNPAAPASGKQPNSVTPSAATGGVPGSLCAPGETKTYRFYAKAEGTFLVHSFSSDSPLANQTSQLQSGLFGVVNVQPKAAEFYRSQVTREDLYQATYYIKEGDEEKLNNLYDTMMKKSEVSRKTEALKTPVYLPEQPGVYLLKPSNRTNMNLAPAFKESGERRTVTLFGRTFPVFTLTTVVPSPEDELQKRTLKTTSVVLIHQENDPPTYKRLYLDSGQQLVNYQALYPEAPQYMAGQLMAANSPALDSNAPKGSEYLTGQPIPARTPVLSMLSPPPDPNHLPDQDEFELIASDLTAIITGPNHDRWPYSITGPSFYENPSAPDRRQPYREFTIVYHYNFSTVQAFPQLNTYADDGGDFFGVNYGCAGIGAEILANRLGVGPMGNPDGVDLKFEEFFLSSWSCGDPAMIVDLPANNPFQAISNHHQGSKIIPLFKIAAKDPAAKAALVKALKTNTVPKAIIDAFANHAQPIKIDPTTEKNLLTASKKSLDAPPDEVRYWTLRDTNASKYTITDSSEDGGSLVVTVTIAKAQHTLPPLAKKSAQRAFFPDDPSNVYHSYMRDHLKFRVLNASEGITHVHHQHAHQWLHSPNSDNGQYLDSQTVVAGSGYTMEISHGGSGNRNYTVGDSIFHCHFYPHFAEGMWSLWRVHDTFEAGTKLNEKGIPLTGVDEATGKEEWNRVLPDGEITMGTPTPALVPMPSLAMAPNPARVRLVDGGEPGGGRRIEVEAENQEKIEKAQAKYPDDPSKWPVPDYKTNPGYPFFIPGVSGHRAPHPPLDYAWQEDEYGNPVIDDEGKKVYLDGGLPRHQVLDGTIVNNFFSRWDFSKDFVGKLEKIGKPPYYTTDAGGLVAFELPQDGTAVEKVAMETNSTRSRFSYQPNGDPGNFILNGLNAVPGAPYAPPGVREDGTSNLNIRRYKAAVLQIDAVLNKKGWHFPQQRMLTLWDDVAATVSGERPPQPFFFRSNTDDTIEYWHTNLVPNYYEMDDFQVRTPTDVLGQHIHLVKFDVTSSDGAGNGWNYEDGTFSPQEVRERIAAMNAMGGIYRFDPHSQFKGKKQDTLDVVLVKDAYPADPSAKTSQVSLFGYPPTGQIWDGAQTTIQRFDTDPTLNDEGVDRTVRSVFTHDHFSPSTHQQAGYYAALLVEPDNSTWEIPVTKTENSKTTVSYEQGGSRRDGGPTGWQANIIMADKSMSYREFAFEFQDMQLAYLASSMPKKSSPGDWKNPQSLFPLSTPAATEEIDKLKSGDEIPDKPDDPIRSSLLSNGVTLWDEAEVIKDPTSQRPYRIRTTKTFTVDSPDGKKKTTTLVATYPVDAKYNVYTPDVSPGWADPDSAIGAPPGRAPVPNPQLISFGTIGTYSVNYRNEPLPLRIASPVKNEPDATDLAYSYASIKRGDPHLNVQPVFFAIDQALEQFLKKAGGVPPEINKAFGVAGVKLPNTAQLVIVRPDEEWSIVVPNPAITELTTYAIKKSQPPLPKKLYVFTRVPPDTTRVYPPPVVPLSDKPNDGGVTGYDPFTPMMRAYVNDRVQVRALAGAHMNEHSFLIHGVNFYFEPSYSNSGYQSTQAISLSEHFEMDFTIPPRTYSQPKESNHADFLYAPSASTQGQTSGAWGILRAYDGAEGDLDDKNSPVYLKALPNNKKGKAAGTIDFEKGYDNAPAKRQRDYTIIATTAAKALPGYTLSYNSRGQAAKNFPFVPQTTDGQTNLENPYALIYVNQADMDEQVGKNGDKYHKLKDGVRVEPLILRANAGDWIKITLKNEFDPDEPTFKGGAGVSSFPAGNPFARITHPGFKPITLQTSTNVGLHPQLIACDITDGDGMNVGYNPTQTAKTGTGADSTQKMYWYAGNLSVDRNGKTIETPIEFGSVDLAPADPLIQHRKGLIGALVVEPEGSTWPVKTDELDVVPEYHYVWKKDGSFDKIDKVEKKTRAQATVTKAEGSTFREFVLVMQTDANMYQKVPSTTGPPPQPPAQPTSTNSPALNYRTEPIQYRYANGYANSYPPGPPAGTAARLANGLVYPDSLTTPLNYPLNYADPQTPVFTARAGEPVRFRWIYPVGPGGDAGGSSQVPVVHGHVFQEEPYIHDSAELGSNSESQWMGGRLVVPAQTLDMPFPSAGGRFRVPGDYFYGTFIGQTSGNGQSQAIWGLFRVAPAK